MTDLSTEVLEEIRRIAKKEQELEARIEQSDLLQGDLQLDSMAMIVMAVGLENRFRVQLQENDAGTLATVADLVALVCRRVSDAASAEART